MVDFTTMCFDCCNRSVRFYYLQLLFLQVSLCEIALKALLFSFFFFRPQYDTSVTSNFAHLLETRRARQLSLKEILKKAAAFDRHRLSSNLLDSK